MYPLTSIPSHFVLMTRLDCHRFHSSPRHDNGDRFILKQIPTNWFTQCRLMAYNLQKGETKIRWKKLIKKCRGLANTWLLWLCAGIPNSPLWQITGLGIWNKATEASDRLQRWCGCMSLLQPSSVVQQRWKQWGIIWGSTGSFCYFNISKSPVH